MVFYPDNVPRATRLQQLVDSMANMQTDIKHDADEMDAKNVAIRPFVDSLLASKGIDTIEDLIAKSMEKLTPDEKKQFESLIESAKASKAGFDWSYFAAGLLLLPEGSILTAKTFLSIGRFVVRMGVIEAIAQFFTASLGGSAAPAAEAAGELEKSASEAENIAQEGGTAGEAGIEVEEAASLLQKVGTFLKVLGAVGFAVTIIVGIVEIVEGAEQKTKLISAIHGCQPARLCIAYFKREATNIIQQLELLATCLEASTGPDADPDVAAYLSKKIVSNIQTADSAIDWLALETELETQDKQAGNYYGGADLSTSEVVARAQASDN